MKNTGYTSPSRKNSGFFLLVLAEIIGIAAGSFIAFSDIDTSRIRQDICPALNGATLLEIFSSTLIVSVLFLVAAFFSGLSAFGQPVGIALVILKGIETGLSSAFMYAGKGLSALPAVLVLNIPKAVALSVVVILAVREVLRSSSAVFGFLISGEHSTEQVNLKLYSIKFIVLVIIVFVISAADSLMNYIFAGLL